MLTADSEESDPDFDDPLLRMFAAAPSIPLGPAGPAVGTVIAQSYRLERRIGAGAMGVVYEATDRVLARRVAIKVHELGHDRRATRMWREARALAKLTHPNVVAVYEVGVDETRGFIAMELVAGASARAWRDAGSRSWTEILDVYRQAGQGLAAAHDAGLVHRDFKPDNVLVGDDGRVRVADFGLALEPQSQQSHETSVAGELGSGFSTCTGSWVGTPAYMAPEQRLGMPADARSDQYALCVSLYEALHGARPGEKAPAGPRDAVPRWLDAVVARGLAAEPTARFPDVHALLAALDPRPRRRRRALIVAVLAAVGGGSVLVRAGSYLAEPDAVEPCADAGAAIDGPWSSDRAAAVRSAVEHAPAAVAAAARGVVEPGLTAWAERWRTAAHDACAATHVRGQQSPTRLDERNDCLDRARGRFAAVVDVFARGDAEAIVRGDAVLASLPDPAACAEPDALATDLVAPERAEDYAALRRAVDRGAAELAAGHAAAAVVIVDEAVAPLRTEGWTHAAAEALRVRGEASLELGRRRDAIASLAESVSLAHRGRDRDALARSMIGLARALGRAAKDRDEAARLLAGADAIAAALSWPPARRLEIREAEFEVAFWARRDDDVDALGAALFADPAVPDPMRIRVQSLMAVSLDRRGRFAEAIAGHAAALALAERVRGPAHPQVAMVLANGVRERTADAPDERNLEALRRALTIREAAFGDDAPSVGELHRQMGDALFTHGRHDDAVAAYERAVSIARAADDDGSLFFALGNLSRISNDDREYARAAQMLDEAARIAERHFGADSIQLAQILVNRGIPRFAAEEFAEGAAEHERALAILGAQLPAGDPSLATARMGLARFLARVGRGPEAIALHDAGARTREAYAPDDHARVVAHALNRAMLLDSAGMTADALAQWRDTAALAERRLPDDHPLRAEVLLDVGRRLNDAGEGREAARVLRRAAETNARADADATRAEAIATELRRARAAVLRRVH